MIKKMPYCKDCMYCHRRTICDCYCYLLESEVVGDIPITCVHFKPREDGDGYFRVHNLVGRKSDAVMVDESVNKNNFFLMFMIKKVIFNDPATIVFWNDGTKTVVKAQKHEVYDPEKGLTMAITKKLFGNTGRYYNEVKKWLPKDECVDETIKKSFNNLGEKFKKELEKEI